MPLSTRSDQQVSSELLRKYTPLLGTTTFVTIVETFPPFPLVSVGHEKIRPHEETSTLRGERGVSAKLDEGCSFILLFLSNKVCIVTFIGIN